MTTMMMYMLTAMARAAAVVAFEDLLPIGPSLFSAVSRREMGAAMFQEFDILGSSHRRQAAGLGMLGGPTGLLHSIRL